MKGNVSGIFLKRPAISKPHRRGIECVLMKKHAIRYSQGIKSPERLHPYQVHRSLHSLQYLILYLREIFQFLPTLLFVLALIFN